jgi:hypothetical protein
LWDFLLFFSSSGCDYWWLVVLLSDSDKEGGEEQTQMTRAHATRQPPETRNQGLGLPEPVE